MRHISLIFLISLFALSFFSCEKEEITPQEEQESLFPISTRTSTDFDAQITIQAKKPHSVIPFPGSVSVTSLFYDSGQAVDIGSISVEGLELEQGSLDHQYRISANDLSLDTLETFAQAFQNKAATIQVDGGQSNFPDLDTTVSLPSMIVFEEPIDSIDKSQPLTLSWKNAGDNTKEPVGIIINYWPTTQLNTMSEFELPEEAISVYKIISEGNKNSVTFTPRELSRLPTNGYVLVQIGRGTQTFMEKAGKTFLVNGLSHSYWFDVVVYDSSE